jgi:RimJ/RimL family protein N-acetyltransferase
MELRPCEIGDIPTLMEMNLDLHKEEKHDYIPPPGEIERRLREALDNGVKIFFFIKDGEIVGYSAVKVLVYQHYPPYIWHFFIKKEHRRKGFGTLAIELLMKRLKTDSLDLDVFIWNEMGRSFWKSLGFRERAIIMRKGPR